jgi:parallel beta-helix repeat protein
MRALAATIAVAAALVIAPAAAGAAVVTDTFTGADGTLLQNHTGETGATWTKGPAAYPADLTILANRVWGPGWALYYASGTPSGNEYDVSAELTVKSNVGATGVVARAATPDSFYMARYNAATGSWELATCTPNCAILGSYAQTLTVGQTYALRLEVRNAQKRLFVDGVQRASTIDDTITRVGLTGIRQGPGDASATTGYHVDNFSVTMPSADTTITAGPTGPTNNASPSFSFSSTPAGGTFECKLDGPGATVGTWGACTSPKAYASLAQGSYTFSARATVGGITDSTPATRAFTVDTTAPDTSISAGPSGPTNNTAPSFSFTSTEAGSSFQCKLDGPGATVGTWGACTSPKAYSALAQGSYTFSVRATDLAGNQDASPATRAFTVDTTAPDTTITSGPTGTITVNTASFGFSSEAGATFECKLDGPGATTGSWGACTSPKNYTGLADGAYTFNVRAKDAAGNTDASPATRAFTVNSAAAACNQTASPGGPISTPAALIAALSPGQTGCFRAGTYGDHVAETQISKANITLMSYPGEKATLLGRIWIDGGGHGVTIKGLILNGYGTPANNLLPSVTIHGTDVTIADNDISNRNPADPSVNAGICVNVATYNGFTGDRAIVERNRIHDCGRINPRQNHDHGIYITDASNVIVRNNVIYDNADKGIHLWPSAQGAQIYNNTIDNNATGILFGETSANNIVHDNIVTNAYERFNLEDYNGTGIGNVARDNCLWASVGNPYFDQNGGTDPALASHVTLTNNSVQNPNYVNRAGKDFRNTNPACVGKGAPDSVAAP